MGTLQTLALTDQAWKQHCLLAAGTAWIASFLPSLLPSKYAQHQILRSSKCKVPACISQGLGVPAVSESSDSGTSRGEALGGCHQLGHRNHPAGLDVSN